MKVLVRAVAAAALLAPFVAAPASAQHYKVDFGLNGGYSWYSAALGSDETGADNADVRFDANWLLGSQLTFWLRPRLGLRANMTYTDTNLMVEDTEAHGNINLWSGTGDLLFRFREPNEEWMGTEMLPFLALGIGGKWHNPAGDFFNCVDNEEGEEWSCVPFRAGTGNFALGEQKVLAGLVGLGADFRVSPTFAVRLELDDRIYKPQFYEASATPTSANTWTLTNGDENVSKIVHEVSGQIGLHLLAGLQRPAVVAVAPAPPPPPAPAPTPAPTPAPVERNITVCVIDPTTDSGIRMQNAIYLESSRDTVVMVNGQRQPLRSSVGTVTVAGGADWYVRGQPLAITLGNDRMEYLTYQSARQIPADRLSYLGTVNGLAVYADRDQVADINDQLSDIRREQRTGDLEDILEEEEDLREALDAVQIVYVPLAATGCVFQPLQRQMQVRKGK